MNLAADSSKQTLEIQFIDKNSHIGDALGEETKEETTLNFSDL